MAPMAPMYKLLMTETFSLRLLLSLTLAHPHVHTRHTHTHTLIHSLTHSLSLGVPSPRNPAPHQDIAHTSPFLMQRTVVFCSYNCHKQWTSSCSPKVSFCASIPGRCCQLCTAPFALHGFLLLR